MNVTSTHPLEAADDPDKDEYFYTIKKRIYQSAREGYSLHLQSITNNVDSTEIRNVLVNQASRSIQEWKIFLFIAEKTRNFLITKIWFFFSFANSVTKRWPLTDVAGGSVF